MTNDLKEKINDNVLNEEILLCCLHKIEKLIKKNAYLKSKWQNSTQNSIPGCDEKCNEQYVLLLNKYIGYRRTITVCLMKHKRYTLPKVQSLIKNGKFDDCNVNIVDKIHGLIVDNDFVFEEN